MADSFNFNSDALPEQVRVILGLLIEGKITDFCFVATTTEEKVLQGIWAGIDGSQSIPYGMLGGLEVLKQDWIDMQVLTREKIAAATTKKASDD